jgi:GMP synthase (glutamine-hydrolysing)
MEFNPEVIELLITNADPALESLAQHRFVQNAEALRQNDYSDMNSKLFILLDKLSEEYKAVHH